ATQRTILVSAVIDCDGAPCVASVQFQYSNGPETFQLSFTRHFNPAHPGYLNNETIYFGDWNGDGQTDFMRFNPSSGNNDWYVNGGLVGGQLTFTRYANPVLPGLLNGEGWINFGDWNGDGLMDMIRFTPSTGNNAWYVNTGIVNGQM